MSAPGPKNHTNFLLGAGELEIEYGQTGIWLKKYIFCYTPEACDAFAFVTKKKNPVRDIAECPPSKHPACAQNLCRVAKGAAPGPVA